MFATRTLARAPVAGRLAGSVSTLRVASLSAFTSGSKLAGFFGRASGQSGAPAFQQLGLRMSLCRAFSSQPPIQKLTEAEILALFEAYTVDKFKLDFPTYFQAQRASIVAGTVEYNGKQVLTKDTFLSAFALNILFNGRKTLCIIEATRDYRLQLLKEQGLEAYFDEVNKLIAVPAAKGRPIHPDLAKELGLSIQIVQTSYEYMASPDPEFQLAFQQAWVKVPYRPEHSIPGASLPQDLNVHDLYARVIGYLKESKEVKLAVAAPLSIRKTYVTERLFQETGIRMEDAEVCFKSAKNTHGKTLMEELRTAFQHPPA